LKYDINDFILYPSKEEAHKKEAFKEINVTLYSIRNYDEATEIDYLFDRKSLYFTKEIALRFTLSKEIGLFDKSEDLSLRKINARRKDIFAFELSFIKEYSYYAHAYYFALKKPDQDIVINNIGPYDLYSYEIDEQKNSWIIKIYFRCEYRYSHSFITSKFNVFVTLKRFKNYFFMGKPLTYLANGFKLCNGDIVRVTGELNDFDMVVVDANHISHDPTISKWERVMGIKEKKSDSDSDLINLVKTIPKDFDFRGNNFLYF